ncbi:MAG: DUF4381 domain-containing protein [Lysobacteraceae bacterium]|nr:MAG: DUF4381 domain-containing protein [Xanthomonadaceae bacterium]
MQSSPDQELVLHDVIAPQAPGWWPPAPGWWGVFVVLSLAIALMWWRWIRRRRRRAEFAAMFEDAIVGSVNAPARIAAMSELLRRAARRHDPRADRMQGEEWLRFLDAGAQSRGFAAGPGRLLLEGGFRRDVDDSEFHGLHEIARTKFIELMMRQPRARLPWRRARGDRP